MTLDNHIKAVELQQAIKEQFNIVQNLYKVLESTSNEEFKNQELASLYYTSSFTVNRSDFRFFLKVQVIKAEEKLEDLNKEFDNL